MDALQIVRVAARALARNRLRSALTSLGIIIGVAAVIAMAALVSGARTRVQDAFAAMGSNLLILTSGSSRTGGMAGGAGSQPSITYDDLDAIRAQVPSVRHVAPVLRTGATVVSEEQNWSTSVIGTEPDYFAIRSWDVAHGRLLEPGDGEGAAKVVVLGRTVCDQLFQEPGDALGTSVRIKGSPWLVVGVLAAKGQSPMGQDYDDSVLVPARTFRQKLQGGLAKYVNGAAFLGCTAPEATRVAEREVAALLRERHRIADGEPDDFDLRNLTEMAEAMQESQRILAVLLVCIAGVSLLVGGIGIMNIMLVSVTERTREIGLRMAVGAKARHILVQFLIESSLLAGAGGIAGILLGGGGAMLLAATTGWPVRIDPLVALIAVAFSALIGIVFGLYPARKASRLDPIEALRYE